MNLDKEESKPSNIVENMSDKTSKRFTFPGKPVKLHLCVYLWCKNLHCLCGGEIESLNILKLHICFWFRATFGKQEKFSQNMLHSASSRSVMKMQWNVFGT